MATWRKTRKPRWNYRTTRTNKVTRVWTAQEITFLRKFYRNHETCWVAGQLGRTVYSVRYKASVLSIRKTNPSNWITPPRGKMMFGTPPRPTMRRRTTRRTTPNPWGRTRRNNRRTRW